MRRGGVATALGALLSVLVVAMPQQAVAAHSLRWGLCPTYLYPGLRGTDVKCAHLQVPLDYANPGGSHITLELSMLRHTSSDYKGVMLVNPGGPGSPGLDLPASLEPYVPGGVGADYDWVGWDPRGVGASHPVLRCQSDYFKGPRRNYNPTTKSLLHYWKSRTRSYANSCAKKFPGLIRHLSTVDTVKDMERIRQALGASRISFFGFSYGTYLGEVYATLHPTHVKYMVLDSVIDPRRVWYGANLDQDVAFDRNIKIYFSWVAKYSNVFHLGKTQKEVSNRYYRQLAALTGHPKGRLGPAEFTDAITGAAYYRFGWVALARAWHAYSSSGRTTLLLDQYADNDLPGDDNGFAVYSAVQCSDAPWPKSWSIWAKDNNAYAKKYPFLTWNNAWYNAPCLYWKAPSRTPVTIKGHGVSALLIDETLDAATPYDGALEVRRRFAHSSLIAEPGGTTHADSLSGDKCVDNKIAAYLRDGTLPDRKDWDGPDAICSPIPNPRPH